MLEIENMFEPTGQFTMSANQFIPTFVTICRVYESFHDI